MESVTVKFQEDILKKMDLAIGKHNFNSRTEFIRQCVREKLAGLSQEEAIDKFLSLRGSLKAKTTDEDDEKTRIRLGEEYRKELERRFNITPRT
jgi:metal-responsive CopG/Arc/MetJ family transcriptional regulator